jgi:hypothetical protein
VGSPWSSGQNYRGTSATPKELEVVKQSQNGKRERKRGNFTLLALPTDLFAKLLTYFRPIDLVMCSQVRVFCGGGSFMYVWNRASMY